MENTERLIDKTEREADNWTSFAYAYGLAAIASSLLEVAKAIQDIKRRPPGQGWGAK